MEISSVTHLASTLAHEINNPLQGALACIKVLRSGAVPDPKRKEYFDAAFEGLLRIQGTVQGLLTSAQPSLADQTELTSLGPPLLIILAVMQAIDGECTLNREGGALTVTLRLESPKEKEQKGPTGPTGVLPGGNLT